MTHLLANVAPSFGDLPIYVHPLFPLPAGAKKSLPLKDWHRKAGKYRDRVNKKWRKRYGLGEPTHAVQTPQGIFCSAEFLDKLRKAI